MKNIIRPFNHFNIPDMRYGPGKSYYTVINNNYNTTGILLFKLCNLKPLTYIWAII